MNRRTRLFFHFANLSGSVSGVAYAYYRWLAPRPSSENDVFSIVSHPYEVTWKSIHVLGGGLLTFAIGYLWHAHVNGQWRKWRKNPQGARKRYSGLFLMALASPVVVSGLAFQISADEATRSFWSWMHLISGVGWIMGSVLHLSLGARPRSVGSG
jgi:hypothetical protein